MRGGGILRKRALEDERLDGRDSARGLAAALVAGGLVAALAARDSVTALVGGQFGGYVMRQAAWQPRGLHVACQPGPRPYATHAMLGSCACYT